MADAAPPLGGVGDEGLRRMPPESLTELRSLPNPPVAVSATLEICCVLLGHKPTDWRRLLDPKFKLVEQLLALDRGGLSKGQRGKLRAYSSREDCGPEQCGRAAAPICLWCRAVAKEPQVPVLDEQPTIQGSTKHEKMAIRTLKLKGNPLTGSKLHAKEMSLTKRSKNPKSPLGGGRMVYPGSLASWDSAGGVIDADPAGFGKLCEAFASPSITDVDLSYCGLGKDAMGEMMKSEHNVDDVPWLRHAKLRSLNLSHNPIGVEGRENLRVALEDADIQHLTLDMGGKPHTLDASKTELDFEAEHDLTPQDAIVLAGWITVAPVKTKLSELNISFNDLISDECEGFKDLMEALPKTSITRLEMVSIGMTPQAAHQVADMIVQCGAQRDAKAPSLNALSIAKNTFGTDSRNGGNGAFRHICEAVAVSSISFLDMSDMELSGHLVDNFLRPALERLKPSQIKQFDIMGNPATNSSKIMENLVAANTGLQQKLIYREEQKLALNDNSQQKSRYQAWQQTQHASGTKLTEDKHIAAQFADLPADPYNTQGRVPAGRRKTAKTSSAPALQSPKAIGDKLGIKGGLGGVVARGRTLSMMQPRLSDGGGGGGGGGAKKKQATKPQKPKAGQKTGGRLRSMTKLMSPKPNSKQKKQKPEPVPKLALTQGSDAARVGESSSSIDRASASPSAAKGILKTR